MILKGITILMVTILTFGLIMLQLHFKDRVILVMSIIGFIIYIR